MVIKYKWLVSRLKELIVNYIEMGINKLPTEAELSSKYKVSRQTVRLSLSLLETEGLIVKKRGSGSYINRRIFDSERSDIAILISNESDYIYPGVLNDIQNTLSLNNLSSKVFETNNRTYQEREILLKILESPLLGIIVEGCKSAFPNPNLDLYHKLINKGCAVLFLYNYYSALGECTYVKDDNITGSALLVNHLVKQGHTAIGGIFKFDDRQGSERYQGFIEAMQTFHLSVPDEWISWFSSDDLEKLKNSQDNQFIKKLVTGSLNSCTAVVCYNDMIAHYLIKELRLSGYHLPSDMAITSFDNTYLSNSEFLSITTLSHKPHEMGTKVAQMMIDKLKGIPVISQNIPWKLITKESTMKNSGYL